MDLQRDGMHLPSSLLDGFLLLPTSIHVSVVVNRVRPSQLVDYTHLPLCVQHLWYVTYTQHLWYVAKVEQEAGQLFISVAVLLSLNYNVLECRVWQWWFASNMSVMCLYFAVTMVLFVWTIVTKPVQMLVSYTLMALRTMAYTVYTSFSSRTSSHSARMYPHESRFLKSCCCSKWLSGQFVQWNTEGCMEGGHNPPLVRHQEEHFKCHKRPFLMECK